MRTNRAEVTTPNKTKKYSEESFEQLKRTCCTALLGENTFFESGQTIKDRILNLVPACDPELVHKLAGAIRNELHLRHTPLWMVIAMVKAGGVHRELAAQTIVNVVKRADEMGELLSMYWSVNPVKETKTARKTSSRAFPASSPLTARKHQQPTTFSKKAPIAAAIKRGLRKVFCNFTEYQLSKYNRNSDTVKIRDVMRLVHPKPIDLVQSEVFNRVKTDTLAVADTWETNLSAGKDAKQTFERLINQNKLFGLATLRNIRLMEKSGVSSDLIRSAIKGMNTEQILPYQFITAAKYAPQYEDEINIAMLKCLDSLPKLKGNTVLLIDVSGSMNAQMSSHDEEFRAKRKGQEDSPLTRMDVACAVAMIARESCEGVLVQSFSEKVVDIPNRRGFPLREAIINSQPRRNTFMKAAVDQINRIGKKVDRVIIFTDDQSGDGRPSPIRGALNYIINVAPQANSFYQSKTDKNVSYTREWTYIHGFSEQVIRYIYEYERMILNKDPFWTTWEERIQQKTKQWEKPQSQSKDSGFQKTSDKKVTVELTGASEAEIANILSKIGKNGKVKVSFE